MNLQNVCSVCTKESIKENKIKYVQSELGFKIPVKTYVCQNCGQIFVDCPECNGQGFQQNFDHLDDCDECKGMGKITIDKGLLFES